MKCCLWKTILKRDIGSPVECLFQSEKQFIYTVHFWIGKHCSRLVNQKIQGIFLFLLSYRAGILQEALEVQELQRKKLVIFCVNFDIFTVILLSQKFRKKTNYLSGNFLKNFDHRPTWMLHHLTRTYLTSRSGSFDKAQAHRHTNKYRNIAYSRRNLPRGPIRWKQLQQYMFSYSDFIPDFPNW